tara:strand:- start:215 stop:643 length:429 start_codon:yes stop_codon:yes gene_type:complete
MVERVDRGDVKQRIALVDDRQRRMADDDPVAGADEVFLILAEQPADARQQVARAYDVSRFAGAVRNPAARRAYPARPAGSYGHVNFGQPVVGIDHPDMCQYAQHARDAGLDREAVEAQRLARFKQQHRHLAVSSERAHRTGP